MTSVAGPKSDGRPAVDWTDRSPARWSRVPLGTLFAERKETVDAADFPPLSVTKSGVVPRLETAAKAVEGADRKLVREGDLAINSRSDRKGSSGRALSDGSVSLVYIVLRPRRAVDPGFAHHLLRCSAFQEEFFRWGNGIVDDLWTTRYSSMKRIVVALPPLGEQRAIADYLDRETARIDELIAKQERLIETLRERQLARCEDACSAAGIQTSVRHVLEKLTRKTDPEARVVTAFRDGQVTLRDNRRPVGYTESEAQAGYQGVARGDVVFHALDGFAGAVGVSDSDGVASPVYHVCKPLKGHSATFVALMLRQLGVSGFLATQAPSTRQRSVDFRNWSTFGRVPVSLPPADVQQQAVASVDAATRTIESVKRFVELSRERRSALITAAVSGQIDVREAA